VRQTHACPPHICDSIQRDYWKDSVSTHAQHVVQSGSPRSCPVTNTPLSANRKSLNSKKRPCCSQPQHQVLHRLDCNCSYLKRAFSLCRAYWLRQIM
jgi:hypothetical protein